MSDTQTPEIIAPKPIPGQRTGKAAAIRKLHDKYPEMPPSVIARRVGCTPGNVTTVLKSYLNGISEDELKDYQSNRADIFDALGHRLLQSVTQEKLDKSKPMEAITAAAILYDKARLERGQATGINVTVLMDAVAAMRERDRKQPISAIP